MVNGGHRGRWARTTAVCSSTTTTTQCICEIEGKCAQEEGQRAFQTEIVPSVNGNNDS